MLLRTLGCMYLFELVFLFLFLFSDIYPGVEFLGHMVVLFLVLDFPKGKKIPMHLGRAKGKRKKRDKRTPAHLGGSCEGGKDSTH